MKARFNDSAPFDGTAGFITASGSFLTSFSIYWGKTLLFLTSHSFEKKKNHMTLLVPYIMLNRLVLISPLKLWACSVIERETTLKHQVLMPPLVAQNCSGLELEWDTYGDHGGRSPFSTLSNHFPSFVLCCLLYTVHLYVSGNAYCFNKYVRNLDPHVLELKQYYIAPQVSCIYVFSECVKLNNLQCRCCGMAFVQRTYYSD